jgi:hypothetical protein
VILIRGFLFVVQRVQMTAAAGGSLPTDIPGLIASYQRVRKLVDLPQGGLVNPMAISYNPTDMYRLFRSTPEGGYTDSEAVDPNASTGIAPPPSKLIPRIQFSTLPHPQIMTLNSNPLQSKSI